MKIFSYFLFPFLLFALTADAQEKEKSKTTIRGEFQLVRPQGNKAFQTFSGIFNFGASFNYGKKLNFGGYYGLTQYQIFPQFGAIEDVSTIQTTHTAGLRLTYDMLTGGKGGMWSPYIIPSLSFINYSRLPQCKSGTGYGITKTQALSMNAGIAYNIMMDEWVGAGFIAGMHFADHVFKPENICLQDYRSFSPNDSKGSIVSIFFGFSVYFDLAYKPSAEAEVE